MSFGTGGGAPEGEAVRAFVALELPAGVRGRIEAAIEPLREEWSRVRWIHAENLHLTLRFLGPSRPDQIESLVLRLAQAARQCPAMVAPLGRLQFFPLGDAPRLLSLHVKLPSALCELQRVCEQAARDVGFAPERRAFNPHVTLGRWRRSSWRPALPVLSLGSVHLDRLTLFRAKLLPTGAVYTRIKTFELPAEPPA